MSINRPVNWTGAPRLTSTIVIPTYNGAKRIVRCLEALRGQTGARANEVIVVDDGSTDGTREALANYPEVRVISQPNAGPAAARNRGAAAAKSDIIVFTDDDCEPLPNWLSEMLRPLERDMQVVAVKGAYLTRQPQIVARFVQLDYEDRYRLLMQNDDIDFIDTYSAAFRRDVFIAEGGYDTSFRVACAEDAEFAYRLHRKGWKMKFAPEARVYHQHPNSLWGFMLKKQKFAYWRVLAVRKNPSKAVKDSHTPQIMKLQLLAAPLVVGSLLLDLTGWFAPISLYLAAAFLISTIPFVVKSIRKDPLVALLSPLLLFARSCAQFAGIVPGISDFILHPDRAPPRTTTQTAPGAVRDSGVTPAIGTLPQRPATAAAAEHVPQPALRKIV